MRKVKEVTKEIIERENKEKGRMNQRLKMAVNQDVLSHLLNVYLI